MTRLMITCFAGLALSAPACSGKGGGTDPGGTSDPGPGDLSTGDHGTLEHGCSGAFCAAGPDHAPDPLQPGPYPVGVTTLTWVDDDPENRNEDGSSRTLVTEIWYPTTEEYRDAPQDVYVPAELAPEELQDLFVGLDTGTLGAGAVRDAPVRKADAPFPLVVFSHGAFAIRFQSVFFTSYLASHGYVVAAPDHQGNTLWDLLGTGYDETALIASAIHRPMDAEFVVRRMRELSGDQSSPFFGAVDTEKVGMAGHSFGGYTALAGACRMSEVAAVVPMAPAAEMTGASGCALYEIHTPTLMMGGLMDNTLTGFKESIKGPWELMPPPKWLLTVKRAGHFSFSDLCAFNLVEVAEKTGYSDAAQAMTDGCGPENWDYRQVQKAINLYAIALFNTFLRDSPGSAGYLTPGAGSVFGDEIEFTAVQAE